MQHIPFVDTIKNAIPIHLVHESSFKEWLDGQSDFFTQWFKSNNFMARHSDICLVPGQDGNLEKIIVGFSKSDFWLGGGISKKVPTGSYYLDTIFAVNENIDYIKIKENFCISWCLGSYSFIRYKTKSSENISKLFCPQEINKKYILKLVESIFITRDLINTPTEDLSPLKLADYSENIAKKYNAEFKVIKGQDLIKNNFPAIHAVGRASINEPCLIEICKGEPNHPKLTLVGKGVCFDSGGMDVKSSSGMRLMKKDMGGAANIIGLANLILGLDLPIRIKVLIPAVENMISSNSFKPGDIISTRKGISVEIGNTDAEGRLILADALTYACEERPDLLIDCATLTGSARSALGPDIPALFSNSDLLAQELIAYGKEIEDPVWSLPLWEDYLRLIQSKIADLNNAGTSSFAGAITAALFLESFVDKNISWIHLDMYCWNNEDRPGRPIGGEAQGQRAIFDLISNKLC